MGEVRKLWTQALNMNGDKTAFVCLPTCLWFTDDQQSHTLTAVMVVIVLLLHL